MIRPPPGPAEFAAQGVRYRYPASDDWAVDRVTLSVRAGGFLAVIGPNGSGKSTLARLLLGAIQPEAGAVAFRGRPVRSWSRRELARVVGVVPQSERHAFPLTVGEVVGMGRYPHLGAFGSAGPDDRRAVTAAMDRCDVLDLAGRSTDALSGGERQRVLIARALAQSPAALLLDEPTASLDVRHEMSIFELLRELAAEGVTIVLITHNLNLAARYADELLLLDRGRARAAGPPADVVREELLRQVYGWPVTVTTHPGPGLDAGAPQVLPLARPRP